MVGCSENAAKRGLLENNQDANAAVMWLFQKQGDPALDLPLEQPKDSKKKKQKSNVDPAKIA